MSNDTENLILVQNFYSASTSANVLDSTEFIVLISVACFMTLLFIITIGILIYYLMCKRRDFFMAHQHDDCCECCYDCCGCCLCCSGCYSPSDSNVCCVCLHQHQVHSVDDHGHSHGRFPPPYSTAASANLQPHVGVSSVTCPYCNHASSRKGFCSHCHKYF